MHEIVIDTETTGLDPLDGHRIVEIGAVELINRSSTGQTLGGMRPQERAADYRVVAAWSAFLLFIGAGAFVVGMAIHNEATAKPPAPRPEPIYDCATGEEIPLYELCKDRKDQQDI